jgi:hypothetical protein
MDDGDEYQKVLGKMTNARTVPRVFIAGESASFFLQNISACITHYEHF